MAGWSPSHTSPRWGRPAEGDLIAHGHAVWRVALVNETSPDVQDQKTWRSCGEPDPETWPGRQYEVGLDFVAGARPQWAPAGREMPLAFLTIRAKRLGTPGSWNIYPDSGRWPACFCCGEPMPCRAELRDREVAAAAGRLEQMAQISPGCCWDCGEPVKSRQKAIDYPGDNVDYPGGPPVRFHLRNGCWPGARNYELRWLAADPTRSRILTWPLCGGQLIVHADGSSECVATARNPAPGPACRGHLSHDHRVHSACYAAAPAGCPRGCPRENHPGTRTSPRPERPVPPQKALPSSGGR